MSPAGLLERDKALAADELSTGESLSLARKAEPMDAGRRAGYPSRPMMGWAGAAFAFVIDLLGAIAFFTILAVAGWLLWTHMQGSI